MTGVQTCALPICTLASFSVGSKYNNQATKVQGKASLIFTSKGRTYEVTGSGTPIVTFDSVGGVASYTSAASIADITLDTSVVAAATAPVSPSTLTMTYNLKDSVTDMVSLKVADGSTIWFSNKGTGSTSDRQVLIRGGMTIASGIAAPVATGANRCGSGTASLSATPPSGATIDWYDAPTGGTRVQTGSTTYAPYVTSSITYYAEARNTLTNAVSVSRTAAVVTVNAQPAAPAATGSTRCGTGTLVLTATPVTNATLAWYSAATAGTSLSTASSFKIGRAHV